MQPAPKRGKSTENHFGIWFSNGFAYASNSHILVRAIVKNISTFTDEEIALLDGKKIMGDLFKQLLKHEYVEIREDGFYAQEENKEAIYRFDTNENIKAPKFEKIIQKGIEGTKHGIPLSAIGISANEFKNLTKAMGAEGSLFNKLALRFTSPGSAIMVDRLNEINQTIVGLIMPVLLD